jgi:hypothetical protein
VRCRRIEAEERYPPYLSWDHAHPEAGKIKDNWPIHGLLDEEKPDLAGFSAVTARRLGKGQAIHVATNALSHYWAYGRPELLAWLRELLDDAVPHPLIRTDAPSFIELSLREKAGNLLIQVVNGNPGRDISRVGTNDLWVHDVPAVGPYAFHVRCASPPRSVRQEPGGSHLEHSFQDGVLTVTRPSVETHTCMVVAP